MAKKDKKPKLPKKVGGMKLPKDLRKSAKTMVELARNPIARDVVSAALVAGAAALAKRKAAKAPHLAEPQKAEPQKATASDPEKKGAELANLVIQGVTSFLSGLTRPVEQKQPSEAQPVAASKPATARKKPSTTTRKTTAAPRRRAPRAKPKA
jgi:hypothetical protein